MFEVTQDTFDSKVLKSSVPVLVDFTARCGPSVSQEQSKLTLA